MDMILASDPIFGLGVPAPGTVDYLELTFEAETVIAEVEPEVIVPALSPILVHDAC